MAHGKSKSTLLGIQGVVGHKDAPDWDFLYEASTIKNPNYNIGDRVVLPDGRVFRYAKCGVVGFQSAGNKFGLKNSTLLVANKVAVAGQTNAVTSITDAAVGAKEITITVSANTLGDSMSVTFAEKTGVVAKDELRGGYISLYTGNYRQQRGIIGNTALIKDGTSMTIYLDAGLDHLLDSTSTCEILASPYANVNYEANEWNSVVGMPNVLATTGQYFWLQTWGPLRISGTTITLGTNRITRQFVFNSAGAVVPRVDEDTDTASYQYAGFLIESTWGNFDNYAAAPFINLQINP